MTFLSNGDYIFPFGPALYWLEHIFVWSFQTGAPNLEGIMRLPARLLNLVVFQVFGNLAVGYFYLFVSLIVIFFAYYYFTGAFLRIKKPSYRIIGALLFTCNPIFLGNIAKVGLVVGVAMLPLMLVVLRRAFERRKVRYLLLYVVLLNISIIHPYTFTLNVLLSGVYLGYLTWRHRGWVIKNLHRIGAVIGVAVLLNAYFVLPILSVGTIDKSVLSQDISSEPVDYTALVGIANTGDMLTSMSLSKNVFLDFAFYNNTYRPLYFAATFLLFAVLVGGFILAQRYMPPFQKRRVLWCLGGLLILLLLATGTLFNIDALIKLLIDLPGGWMFRSPLKWQLYVPFFLVTALLLIIIYLPKQWLRKTAQAGVVVLMMTASGYVMVDIFGRLLVPRSVAHFASLQQMKLDDNTVLFVNTDACMLYAQENPVLFTELNQIIGSKNVQVKRVGAEALGKINIDSYDYVISCVGSADESMRANNRMELAGSYDDGTIELYKNKLQRPVVYGVTELFALPADGQVAAERTFAADVLGKSFDYVDASDGRWATGLYELFGDLGSRSIDDNELVSKVTPNNTGVQQIFVPNQRPLYYLQQGDDVTFTPDFAPGFIAIKADQRTVDVQATAGQELTFRYRNQAYPYKNAVANASFENGLWQRSVTDCNAFDALPIIGMQHDKSQKTDGSASLQLTAKRHIACTGPVEIKVDQGENFLLSFDYRASDNKRAGYYVGFNDSEKSSISERLPAHDDSWQHVSKVITIPQDATTLTLLVYAYPDYASGQPGIANYDNFYITPVPDISARFFMLSNPNEHPVTPQNISVTTYSPTARAIRVQGATTPFYLAMKDTYHPQWRLELNNSKVNNGTNAWMPGNGDVVANDNHFTINGTMNGWFVDPADLCKAGEGCTKNADGSYDIELLIEFVPQRWFYVGTIISGAAILGTIGYFVYDYRRRRPGGRP